MGTDWRNGPGFIQRPEYYIQHDILHGGGDRTPSVGPSAMRVWGR
jgi:hypothetical protein